MEYYLHFPLRLLDVVLTYGQLCCCYDNLSRSEHPGSSKWLLTGTGVLCFCCCSINNDSSFLAASRGLPDEAVWHTKRLVNSSKFLWHDGSVLFLHCGINWYEMSLMTCYSFVCVGCSLLIYSAWLLLYSCDSFNKRWQKWVVTNHEAIASASVCVRVAPLCCVPLTRRVTRQS